MDIQSRINEMVKEMTAAGRSSVEISLAVGKVYADAVKQVRDEEERKRRKLMTEKSRQGIRNAVFAGLNMSKAQQISWLYTYVNANAEAVRQFVVDNVNAKK